jgi:Vacuolar protein sorting-associated protein 35
MTTRNGSKKKAAVLGSVTVEQEQGAFLERAKKKVELNGFTMMRSLDSKQLMEGLKHASAMVGQLRTSLLTAQNYYELYISIFDNLKHLEGFLLEEKARGEKMSKLYVKIDKKKKKKKKNAKNGKKKTKKKTNLNNRIDMSWFNMLATLYRGCIC